MLLSVRLAVPGVMTTLLAATAFTHHAAAQVTGWAATATQGFPVASLLGATDLGVLPATQLLTIRLGLQARNVAALQSLVAKNANTAKPTFLTPAQFASSYGASPAQVQSAVAYLQSEGFTGITVEPNKLLISATAPAANVQQAFNTSIEQVSINGVTEFVNITPAVVPRSLGGIVVAVLGVNNVGKMLPPLRLPSLPQYLVSYTPKQFQTIYNAASVAPASKAKIAIMAEGNLTGVLADLRTAEQAFGLPQVPVTVVPVGLASNDTSGADEWDLDTQYSSGMAQSLAQLYVYDVTSLSDPDLALEFSRFATDDVAKAGSASLGECEIFPYLDGSMAIDDMIFLEAAAQGQSFFASAGDTGSFCPVGPAGVNGVPIGAPLVNYPAASPYVVGVGGTTLFTNKNGTYNHEISWYAGGGGISQFEPSPSWQTPALGVLGALNSRGVPDVAMDADPESGADVYVNGTVEGVGGTSLASPLSLGIWARAVSINPKLGDAGPNIYSLYNPSGGLGGLLGSYPEGGFHDITLGANGLYTALAGYDFTTGLGTFVVSKFTHDLSQ